MFMNKVLFLIPTRPLLIAVLLALRLDVHGTEPTSPALSPRVATELSVCVFTGASNKVDEKYFATATRVGEGIARRKWTLIYGGGNSGLMGATARAAKKGGSRVVGIFPEFIKKWETPGDVEDELIVVATMHDRKNFLQVRSDVFVILPGGIGTLDELADTLSLRQVGQLNKPIIILNQDGYYDGLLKFLDHSIAEKFSRDVLRQNIQVVGEVSEVFELLEKLKHPPHITPSGQ